MTDALTKIPAGLRYHFGRAAQLRRELAGTFLNTCAGWSYEEITSPTLDYYALFERGLGRATAHHAFRWSDVDGRLLALRPEVTSPLARAAATLLANRPRPLRLCYAAQVFQRQPRSHAEWRREATQLGLELIGAAGLTADAEILLIAVELLETLGLRATSRISLNHAEIFHCLAEQSALTPAACAEIRTLVVNRAVPELREFLAANDLTDTLRDAWLWLTQPPDGLAALQQARAVLTGTRAQKAVAYLSELQQTLQTLEIADLFSFDFGDVPDLDYYTGLVCKIYTAGAGVRVGSGGRYDGLTAHFGRAEPAVGLVLELDALTEIWVQRQDKNGLDREDAAQGIAVPDSLEGMRAARTHRARGTRINLKVT